MIFMKIACLKIWYKENVEDSYTLLEYHDILVIDQCKICDEFERKMRFDEIVGLFIEMAY